MPRPPTVVHVLFFVTHFYFHRDVQCTDEVGRSLWLRVPPQQGKEMSGPGEENGSGRQQ